MSLAREEKVKNFQYWLKENGACMGGRNFAKGKTVREVYKALVEENDLEGWICWLRDRLRLNYAACYCRRCCPDRAQIPSLPKTLLPFEKSSWKPQARR